MTRPSAAARQQLRTEAYVVLLRLLELERTPGAEPVVRPQDLCDRKPGIDRAQLGRSRPFELPSAASTLLGRMAEQGLLRRHLAASLAEWDGFELTSAGRHRARLAELHFGGGR